MRLNELLDVVFRWAHLIAGIMWIGNSMLAVLVGLARRPPPRV